MPSSAQLPGEVTQLLRDLTHGGRDVVDQLFPLVYDELRAIAHRRLRNEPAGHTLDTGALVHEAYLKLVDQDRVDWQNRAHFFAISARAMRRILLDYAISKQAQKRGGGQGHVSLDKVVVAALERSDELIALDEALGRLGSVDARQVRVVECRFFGGMNIEETAEVLGISPATVKRDWNAARAWLNRELSG